MTDARERQLASSASTKRGAASSSLDRLGGRSRRAAPAAGGGKLDALLAGHASLQRGQGLAAADTRQCSPWERLQTGLCSQSGSRPLRLPCPCTPERISTAAPSLHALLRACWQRRQAHRGVMSALPLAAGSSWGRTSPSWRWCPACCATTASACAWAGAASTCIRPCRGC